MAKQTYTTGQVLTAAQMTTLQTNDYNQTVNAKAASYVLVATDAGTRITMSNAGATTVTVNTALFAAGDTLIITNIGAGVCTITAGTATVSTAGSLALSQYDSGTLYFTSTGVAIWNGANPGDISAVTAGTGISGGGTSGAVTVTNSMATAITTNGDIIYGTGSGTFSRLGIGSSAQILTVASGIPSWATPAGGGGMTQILAPTSIFTSPTTNTFTTSSISGSYNQLVIYIKDFKADNYFGLSVRFNSDSTADAYQSASLYASNSTAAYGEAYRGTYGMIFNNMYGNTDDNFAMITIPNYANTTTRKVAYGNTAYVADDTNFANQIGAVSWKNTAAISTITLLSIDSGYSSGKWTGGTIEIYGVN